ncbi:hypothetical protein GGTG_07303 [Gaeumannomyces tritici R3-111a-1]|uniref:Carotenoid cleavage dioxygenase 1 n=1 Tax=Gaeumannomyces tritici (strain R3-111a-1) TaxID=644352 RepID=J3P1A6_GAET3|nr:hypothetical protein GGTG_07303 [Gaeumannomyces tritici R3-111a-1]EJT77391.1 hypothetical protein GGTG_07303 [Gaeumannomyces tritici R3-111a-1]
MRAIWLQRGTFYVGLPPAIGYTAVSRQTSESSKYKGKPERAALRGVKFIDIEPTRKRGVDKEAADAQEVRRNLDSNAYKEWPNKAGFDGLTEQRGPIELEIKGEIPAWVAGSLYRTGPSGCKVEDDKSGTFHISHWFDGLAHTHRFDIMTGQDEDGRNNGSNEGSGVRVFYSSRRQCEAMVNDIRSKGIINGISFAQRADPCVGIFGKVQTMFHRKIETYNNICVTIQAGSAALGTALDRKRGRDTAMLTTDAATLSEVDRQTLEQIRLVMPSDLHPSLTGKMAPSHWLTDPESGDMFNINQDAGPIGDNYRVFQVSASTGKTSILAKFKAKLAYIHSTFITGNYVVVCVPTAHFVLDGLKIFLEGNLLDAMSPFNPAEPCRWYVIDRRGGKGVVAKFTSDAGFFFHSTNAYEDEKTGDVVCEMVSYRDTSILKALYYDVLLDRNGTGGGFWAKHDALPALTRFRLPMTIGKGKDARPRGPDEVARVEPELRIPTPHAGELPTINPAYACRRHKFVYGLVHRGLSTFLDGIVKTDTHTREAVLWEGPSGHSPGEAVFVPRPRAEGDQDNAEDDGVLLSVVLDGHNRHSYLLCLDARTMKELGRAECQFAVGIGFHGQHVTGSQ